MIYLKIKARLFEKSDNKKVICHVCANECIISPGKVGICRTRKNFDGELFSLIYGSLISSGSLDPIEKKPLYNFWPGATAYSIASIGCSFRCQNCQNWSISQANPTDEGKNGFYDLKGYEDREMTLIEMKPEDLVGKTNAELSCNALCNCSFFKVIAVSTQCLLVITGM